MSALLSQFGSDGPSIFFRRKLVRIFVTSFDSSMLLPALKAWKIACPITTADLVFPTNQGEIAHHEAVPRSLTPIMIAADLTAPVLDDRGIPRRDAEGRPVVEFK